MTAALYVYDYRLIRARRGAFEGPPARRALYEHIVRHQRFEMSLLMPAGVVFNGVAFVIVRAHPGAAQVLALAQLALTLAFVLNFVHTFAQRRERITAAIEASEAS